MLQAPILHTDRLTLRPHAASDWNDSAALWRDPAVVRFIGGRPFGADECWMRLLQYGGLWPLLGYGYWAVTDRASGRFLGEIGLADFRRPLDPPFDVPECGWALTSEAQGRGYAGEALAATLAWADAHCAASATVCMIAPANIRSIRLAERHDYRPYRDASYRGSPVTLFRRPRPSGAGPRLTSPCLTSP